MFKENPNITGTSFYGLTVYASQKQLEKLFGKPQHNDNTGEDKTNIEWNLSFNDINFTVYDWKEYRKIKKTEIIAWNIGGNSKEDTNKILKEINNRLNG